MASSLLFHWAMSRPAKSTRPLSRAMSRDSIPITVDFPAPLGPMRERTFPLGMAKVTPSTTRLPSYCLVRSETCMAYTLLLVSSR